MEDKKNAQSDEIPGEKQSRISMNAALAKRRNTVTLFLAKAATRAEKKQRERQMARGRPMLQQRQQMRDSSAKSLGMMLRGMDREKTRHVWRSRALYLFDKRMMAALEKEKEEQELEALVSGSMIYRRQDQHLTRVLLSHVRCQELGLLELQRMEGEIRDVRVKEAEVDREIQEARQKLRIFNHQMATSGVHRTALNLDKVKRQLEVRQVSMGRQLTENRQLKDQVKDLERQRDEASRVLQGLNEDCEQLSRELCEYSGKTKAIYSKQELTKRQLAVMEAKLDKRAKTFRTRTQDYQQNIDVLRRKERFMVTKNKKREDEAVERLRKIRSQPSVTEKTCHEFRAILDVIRSGLSQKNIHVILSTFTELMSNNERLHRNLQDKMYGCYQLKREKKKLQTKVDSLREALNQKHQNAMARRVFLMNKADSCHKVADQTEEEVPKADQVIEAYIRGLLTTLDKLGCTQQDIQRLTGVYGKVEERNVQDVLAEVERRVNKLYRMQMMPEFLAYERAKRSARRESDESQFPPPTPFPRRHDPPPEVQLVPPELVLDDDEEDAEEDGGGGRRVRKEGRRRRRVLPSQSVRSTSPPKSSVKGQKHEDTVEAEETEGHPPSPPPTPQQ